MKAIFRYSLSGFRWAILGWGLTLGLLGGYLIPFYDTIAEQWEQWERLLKSYPKELLAFFGGSNIGDLINPSNYLHMEFFSWIPLALGFFAVLAGSALLVGLEERGQMDLLLAYPIGRTSFFFSRFLSFLVAVVSILILTWIGFVIAMPFSKNLGLGAQELLLPFLPLMALLLLFGTLSLFLSMVLPSRGVAAAVGGTLMVVGYFITSLARIDERLDLVAKISPFTYYQGGEALNGFKLEWFLGLLVASLAFLLLSWWQFERRDIRVSGEGGWSLSILKRRRG